MKQYQAPLRAMEQMDLSLKPLDLFGNCDRCKGLKHYTVYRRERGKFKAVIVTCEFCYKRPID